MMMAKIHESIKGNSNQPAQHNVNEHLRHTCHEVHTVSYSYVVPMLINAIAELLIHLQLMKL